MKKKKKKKEIIQIHLWGRICKIVGKDSFAFWGRICGEG